MEVVIQSPQAPDAELQAIAEDRLRHAVLRRALVRLKDLKGPRGSLDKLCQIQLQTLRGGLLVVSSRAASWRSALDLAIARAEQVLKVPPLPLVVPARA